MRRRLLSLWFAALLLGAASGARAQDGVPTLHITAPPTETVTIAGPTVVATHMLAGRKMRELLASGFPARLHFTVELWSVGSWLNDLERTTDWDVVVRWIALDKVYEVTQVIAGQPFSLGRFAQVADAEAAVARPMRAPIAAFPSKRRFYYRATLTVETLSLTDLDEVERWLRGDLQPAVRGERNPGSALGRGFKTLASRLLGGERREYVEKTGVF